MANGDVQASNPFDFLNSGVNFLSNASDFLLGKSSSTSGNTSGSTSQTQKGSSNASQITEEEVSPEKAAAIVQQMLESINGLGAISGMARGSGIYNSTTQTQLTNDLASRIAGNVAALSSRKATYASSNTDSTASGTTESKTTSGSKTPGIFERIFKIF